MKSELFLQLGRAACAGAVFCLGLSAQTGHAQITPVAHWSFDAASLTTDIDGNITGAADATGNHNATLGTGLGSGGTGGPTYNSNVIPGANSGAGQFGEALTLTGFNNFAGGGGQYLMFPQITEIMSGNGAPSYTVSMWINTTTANSHQFTLLGNWGNAAAATGTSRFTYGFGFQVTSGVALMRGQTRFGETSGDIYARTASTPSLNDGDWHMLTWTFDTTTGVLNSYLDAVLVDTFQSASANFAMLDSSSAFGSFGLKGDSGNFINGTIALDEVRVFTGVADLSTIAALYDVNAVPEPGTLALAGLGALVLAGALRRRRA